MNPVGGASFFRRRRRKKQSRRAGESGTVENRRNVPPAHELCGTVGFARLRSAVLPSNCPFCRRRTEGTLVRLCHARPDAADYVLPLAGSGQRNLAQVAHIQPQGAPAPPRHQREHPGIDYVPVRPRPDYASGVKRVAFTSIPVDCIGHNVRARRRRVSAFSAMRHSGALELMRFLPARALTY